MRAWTRRLRRDQTEQAAHAADAACGVLAVACATDVRNCAYRRARDAGFPSHDGECLARLGGRGHRRRQHGMALDSTKTRAPWESRLRDRGLNKTR